jgi:hypothetical protein
MANKTLSFLCLFECQQNLAFISLAYLCIVIITMIYLICRRVSSDKAKKKKKNLGETGNRRRPSTSHSSIWSAGGLNDSFDTDSVTSSVIYGSSGV